MSLPLLCVDDFSKKYQQIRAMVR